MPLTPPKLRFTSAGDTADGEPAAYRLTRLDAVESTAALPATMGELRPLLPLPPPIDPKVMADTARTNRKEDGL
jgi:hypothetical protein